MRSDGRDPAWTDRGDVRFGGYWSEVSFGALVPSAQMRREALLRLMPGSGNVLMSQDDAYLCIVPKSGRGAADSVFLPFEEDGGRLSLIVSKAFLLADDASSTDRTILTQLGARRARS